MRKFLAILLQSIGVIMIVVFVVGATIAYNLHFSYIQLPLTHLVSPALSTLALSIGLISAGKMIHRGVKYTTSSQTSRENAVD
jgi:hypothetical protein